MLFVITGNGKGKTTSSLGMVERALGNGSKCLIIQFIKTNPSSCGEFRSLTSQGVDWKTFGEGFTWNQKDLGSTADLCREGFDFFCQKSLEGKYSLIVLDEFTYPLEYGFVSETDFVSFMSSHKDDEGFPHVVVTGRNASEKLQEIADTVSEIREIKHHFNQNGGKCIKGIEF